MSGWTPGPWSIGVLHEDDHGDTITADDGTKYHRRRTVATVATLAAYRDMRSESARADARLIAAAPDMAEALNAVSMLAVEQERPRTIVINAEDWRKAVSMIEAALAKADGNNPNPSRSTK